MIFSNFFKKLKIYHFEFRHLTILFFFLLFFQILISLINKSSVTSFINNTKDWYQKDAIEKIANLTATSLELTMESFDNYSRISDEESERIIQSFNIIFSQQILQHNIEELCIFTFKGESLLAINDGRELYNYLIGEEIDHEKMKFSYSPATLLYKQYANRLRDEEEIISLSDSSNNLHVFVPFVIRGEQLGAVYMKNTPNFTSFSDELIASQNESTIIYVSLILLGFVSMYFISSYSVRERDEAQKQLLNEHEENLKKQFDYEKELAFAKRIYHTHHKAEKIMGFIKEDINRLNTGNIDLMNYRIRKYSNFVSRVIYDMKWYDPPVQTIRGQMYCTNLNEVLRFIVDNIFLRVSVISESFNFHFEFDENMPNVPINEFVVWELFEPLIQNAIEHGGSDNLNILIKTKYDPADNISRVYIIDDGKGLDNELLIKNEDGVENIFLENISTKNNTASKSGYGCFIAHQIALRCNWNLSVSKNSESGTTFTIIIKN